MQAHAAATVPSLAPDEVLARLGRGEVSLPPLPETPLRIIRLTEGDAFSVPRAVELLRRDPGLMAHVLKAANSVLYARGGTTVSINAAVARLGATNLRAIALIAGCDAGAFRVPAHDRRVRALFRRSLLAACFAQEIARARRASVESAFIAALLHDVGTAVVLAQLAADAPLDDASEAALDACHAAASALVVGGWGLPPAVVEAIRHHHDPDPPAQGAELVRTVQLADAFAAWADEPGADATPLRTHPALAPLRFYPDDVQRLVDQAPAVLGAAEELR